MTDPTIAAKLLIQIATPKMTQQQLERHLWDAADILRGKIDSSDGCDLHLIYSMNSDNAQ